MVVLLGWSLVAGVICVGMPIWIWWRFRKFQMDWYLLIVLLSFVSLAMVTLVPRWQTLYMEADKSFNTNQIFIAEDTARKTWIQVCGGVFAMLALFLAAHRLRQTDRDLEAKKLAEATGRYVDLAQLLGQDRDGVIGKEANIEARLAAIHGLGHLAKDSPRDRYSIERILVDYVKLHAQPLPDIPEETASSSIAPGTPDSFDTASAKMPGEITPKQRQDGLVRLQERRFDVRTAVTVLSGMDSNEALVLNRIEISDLRLSKVEWKREVDFSRALFVGATFQESKFQNAVFRGALLVNAVFDDSTMACGDFRDANLSRASFRKSSLKSADFRDAILHGAVFDEANLGKANFSAAKFDGKTSFKGGDVTGCMFFDAHAERRSSEEDRGLTVYQIKAAKNWQNAHYSEEFRAALNLASEASPQGALRVTGRGKNAVQT